VLIGVGSGPDVQPDREVVGVVTTFSYRGLREESEQAFFPMLDGGEDVDVGGNFYVKVRGTPEQAVQSIRTLVHAADPALPIAYVRTVDEQVSRSLNAERMLATLSGGFGALALLLSLVGLCGVMSFVVSQRTREIGIRIALGARGSAAVWLVLRDAAAMIAAGTAIALPCVWVFGRLVESQLFGVTPTDPTTIAATTLLLATVALGAALVPAYGASTVNPTDALRAE
jgi:ABC-type antimicrobial peptide transport system, permease component